MEWITAPGLVDYAAALAEMEARAAAIRQGGADEAIWLLQHPSLYTAGTSAKAEDLLNPRFPVYQTGRGGQFTYHGPGQRIAYVMLDLHKRGGDIRRFVHQLEEWLIRTLAVFDVSGERRAGRIGIWVRSSSEAIAQENMRSSSPVSGHGVNSAIAQENKRSSSPVSGYGVNSAIAQENKRPQAARSAIGQENMRPQAARSAIGQENMRPQAARSAIGQEKKIAAIGLRVRHGVTYHGVSLNVNPDLSHYDGILPCGIAEHGVTSLQALGHDATLRDVDAALRQTFAEVFK